jgi:hypothetical protein
MRTLPKTRTPVREVLTVYCLMHLAYLVWVWGFPVLDQRVNGVRYVVMRGYGFPFDAIPVFGLLPAFQYFMPAWKVSYRLKVEDASGTVSEHRYRSMHRLLSDHPALR